jgi:hypothetical protein
MSIPAVITAGTTSATWGLNAEMGLITQSAPAKVTREQKFEKDNQGVDVLGAWFNPIQKFTVKGVIIGNTGWSAAAPGVAQTLANTSTANGVAVGGIYVDDVDIDRVNVEFQKLTATASQRPAIA